MGHYDSNYEEAERITRESSRDFDMQWRRPAVKKFDDAFRYLNHYTMPDRFKWAFEDYRRWLVEGLEEWEKEKSWQTLKKET
jgi:hypothetical protein